MIIFLIDDLVFGGEIIGTGCSVTRRYKVEGGIESLLDDLDIDILFEHIEGNPPDVVENPLESKDYDAFLDELQKHIADDDAVIIMEGGHEKLRYVVGSATIVTSKTVEYLGIKELAEKRVRRLLDNPDWLTRCEY